MSQEHATGVPQNEFIPLSLSSDLEALSPARRLERTGDNVLAKLKSSGQNRDKLEVEALFKVVAEPELEGGTIRLRLWHLWGRGDIEPETVLAECEYDPDTFEVQPGRIFLAYQALSVHRIHLYSYAAKVSPVDPITLKFKTFELPPTAAALVFPQVKQFQDLMDNLTPGHSIMMRVRVENGAQVIDPEQVVVVSSTVISSTSSGFGPLPEKGSTWGLIGKIRSDGQVEMAGEYTVLDPPISSSKNNWKARFEMASTSHKIFSLIDLRQTS